MKKKNILIIEHGGYLREFTFQKLEETGCEIFVATSTPERWLFKYADEDHVLTTDTFDLHNIIGNILKWVIEKQLRIDAVGTFKESSVIVAADVAAALGCIGISGAAARRSSQNKLAMRYFLRKNGYLHQPNFEVIDIRAIDPGLIVEHTSVLKPLSGSSSHGVIKVNKGERLFEQIKIAQNTLSPSERQVFKNFNGQFLLERYVQGKVVSVDGIIQDSTVMFAGVTEFLMGDEPFFTQVGSMIPAEIDPEKAAQLYDHVRQIVQILKFDNCGFHAEFRVDDVAINLLEIAARLPGGGIQLGYKKSLGVDLTAAMIDVWLGRKVALNPIFSKHVLHKSVLPAIKQHSSLTVLSGIDQVTSRPEIWDFYQFAAVGDKLWRF